MCKKYFGIEEWVGGTIVRRLNEIVDPEIKKLMSIYKEPKRANIVKIVKVTSFFPCFVTK